MPKHHAILRILIVLTIAPLGLIVIQNATRQAAPESAPLRAPEYVYVGLDRIRADVRAAQRVYTPVADREMAAEYALWWNEALHYVSLMQMSTYGGDAASLDHKWLAEVRAETTSFLPPGARMATR